MTAIGHTGGDSPPNRLSDFLHDSQEEAARPSQQSDYRLPVLDVFSAVRSTIEFIKATFPYFSA